MQSYFWDGTLGLAESSDCCAGFARMPNQPLSGRTVSLSNPGDRLFEFLTGEISL